MTKTGLRNKYFGNRAFYRMALTIALPIMVQNAVSQFVNMLDNIMVGAAGTVEMAGVTISNHLLFVLQLAGFGAVSGAGIFAAQFYGKGDREGLRDTLRFKLIICAFLSVLGIAVFLLFGDPLISLFLKGEGKPEEIAGSFLAGRSYLRIMLLGIPVFMIGGCYTGSLRETGETVVPMVAGLAAVLVNLLGNWLLIFGKLGFPKLGANGAAIASVVSRFVEAGIAIVYTHRRKDRFSFVADLYRHFRIPAPLFKKILFKSIPMVLNESLWAAGQALLANCYSLRAYNVVPANSICSAVAGFFNVAFLAMGTAIGIIVGQLLGAGKTEEAKDTDRKLIVFSGIICVGAGGILAALAGPFPRLYNSTDEIRSLATSMILVNACMMPLYSYSNAAYFTLRSGGKTFVTFLFDSFFVCVFVSPLAFVLSRFTALPLLPLYIICQGTELVKCVIGFFMLRSGVWIHNIVDKPQADPQLSE